MLQHTLAGLLSISAKVLEKAEQECLKVLENFSPTNPWPSCNQTTVNIIVDMTVEVGIFENLNKFLRFVNLSGFYCATLYVSSLLAVGTPSVCLCVTLVYCIQTAKDIKFLTQPAQIAPSFKFFEHKHRYPISKGTL